MSREISEERIKMFGKLKDSEDDLSQVEFITKEKTDYIIKHVLGDLFDETMNRFKDVGDKIQK